MSFASGLPVDAALPELRAALSGRGVAVLQAPPGAGKSTVVPLALLNEPWAAHKRLVMLEPRRLATRAVARRMAATLGESVGESVGYRMRLDSRVSRATRIEVVTDGVFARMLQEDPALETTALVIFDEFHERSLQADLGLVLLLDARANLSTDIKILVMSATLDVERIAALLDAPVVATAGRVFPVETRYAGRGAPALPGGTSAAPSSERLITQLVQKALIEESGDVLVFLPGAREIRRVLGFLESAALEPGTCILPLFGDLSGADQDAALAPGAPGTRKIVLATNIAETSLTIEGVRIVVDSGLVRRLVFDPATGMSRLETERVSRASADQRQGRAGRLTSGVCYRAWSAEAQKSLAPFTPPEILAADLAPLALDLALWGVRDANDLKWIDAPPAAMLGSARDLLGKLDAIDAAGRVTAHGRKMASLGVHPRLAHMLLRASNLASVPLAAMLAALLSERDLLRGAASARDTDVRSRIDILLGASSADWVDQAAVQRSRRLARELSRQLGADTRPEANTTQVGLLLAFAYPDRIGRRRAGSEARYTLANGRGAFFAEPGNLSRQEFIVAVDLDDRDRDARILLAAPVAKAELTKHFAHRIQSSTAIEWSAREGAVIARRIVKLDALVLEEQPLDSVPPEAARAAMLTGLRELGLAALPWDREARDLRARMQFARGLGREDTRQWPAVDDAALAASLETWLSPWLEGVTRREHLARVPLAEALRAFLSWDERRKLEELAPSTLTVPTGSQMRIDYLDDGGPSVAVRLQEVFGLTETPCIGGGAVRVTFKLLSPAQRPVQITRDLAGFWQGSYSDVRKHLRGRYPKHYWPENPLEAAPTRGVRPKKP